MNDKDVNGEIVVYQPDEVTRLEVRVEGETVWLTQGQMVELFLSSKQNISLHINNVFREGELDETATVKEYLTVQKEGSRFVRRKYRLYNLDVIISVGYRVKSLRGTQFRQWALKIIKEYLLRGYSLNKRVDDLERRVLHTERQIEFFVRTSLPPVEGVFYDGQILGDSVCHCVEKYFSWYNMSGSPDILSISDRTVEIVDKSLSLGH